MICSNDSKYQFVQEDSRCFYLLYSGICVHNFPLNTLSYKNTSIWIIADLEQNYRRVRFMDWDFFFRRKMKICGTSTTSSQLVTNSELLHFEKWWQKVTQVIYYINKIIYIFQRRHIVSKFTRVNVLNLKYVVVLFYL